MNDQKQFDQFQAILLAVMNLFRESRKDIVKLQNQVIALREALARLDPHWKDHFQSVLSEVETSLADHKSPVEVELEKQLNECVVLLSTGEKKHAN
jgi:hypothetical protein